MSFDELLGESPDQGPGTGTSPGPGPGLGIASDAAASSNTAPRSQSQLTLLPNSGADEADWVLDARTRQLGRVGIAAVRRVLARAHRPDPSDEAAAA